jgi:cytochrome subunit of sulfide dehydrogenase
LNDSGLIDSHGVLWREGAGSAGKLPCAWGVAGPRFIVVLSIAAIIAILFRDCNAAAENGRGRHLAAACVSCHRLDGRDTDIPSIIGLNEDKFVSVMRSFKSGRRSIMQTIALSLSDEEIAILAHHFAAQR